MRERERQRMREREREREREDEGTPHLELSQQPILVTFGAQFHQALCNTEKFCPDKS